MATAVQTGEMQQPFGNVGAWPTLQSMEDTVRKARRAVNGARAATEDFVDGAALEVRRHPLMAIGLVGTLGFIAGCAFGLGAAWMARTRG